MESKAIHKGLSGLCHLQKLDKALKVRDRAAGLLHPRRFGERAILCKDTVIRKVTTFS